MKRIAQCLAIFLGAVSLFLAAEFLPVAFARWDDRDRCGRIFLKEDVADAGKIAYELSWEDKMNLLANTEGALENSTFTKVYETRSIDNLNTYDTAVLSAFKNCMESMQNLELMSLSVNIKDLEKQLSDACCISVDSGQNGIGALTLWVLTFQEKEREWQFLVDVTEEKLYGMYMRDRLLTDVSQDETEEAVSMEKTFQESEGLFAAWGKESLPLYFEGSGYDGYGMWIREVNAEVYIPMKTEEYYERKDDLYTICFMLGDDIFYQHLSEATDDLRFAEFCISMEPEEESAAELDTEREKK